MATNSATSSIIERALHETIAHLSKVEQTPRSRAILIEARRMLGMVSSWKAIPPRATTRRELYSSALKLFEKAGVAAPVDPASFPEPTLRPSTSAPPPPDDPRVEASTMPDLPTARSPSTRPTPPATQRMASRPPTLRPEHRTELAPGIAVVHTPALDWQAFPMVAGVLVKVLQRDPETAVFCALLRMEPGAELPRHRHASPEEILVIEGSVVHGKTEVCAGEYCHADPGSVHEAIRSPGGCTLFLVASERDELLPTG